MRVNVGRLVAARIAANLTRHGAAKRAGISRGQIDAIERQVAEPTRDEFERLCGVYRVNQAWVLASHVRGATADDVPMAADNGTASDGSR